MPREEKLGIIIPTKDRPDDLIRALKSISEQDYHPDRVVVVDGGAAPIKDLIDNFRGFKVEYLRIFPPSLTVQRNAGIRHLIKDVTLIAFFDDDIILEEGCLRNMMKFWEGALAEVGGASFNLVSEIYKAPTFFERFFFVNTNKPNKILRSGFQGKVSFVNETLPADWLAGCAMVYRREVFSEFFFDEWFSGYSRYEDVDFSYRVSKKYKMYVVSGAKVLHLNKLEDPDFSFTLGKMEFVNRLYFVRKNPELSLPLCYWALFGILMNNIVRGFMGMDKRYLNRAKGALAGFVSGLLKI
ncbi:MAG: glycosyltransferase [Candidatus Omnitrophica bacterium]|nr:glycosyltransferase [Candidatus Omnitrophota bacterium]MBU0881684.1 glycosyltransferase [Candidatus Omnitrophota bacterium]MBU1808070.1 glycosyltransferase [Candidatus Omnitrophota bacterium]